MRRFTACLFGALLFAVHSGAADAACTKISKPADLNKIRNNLAGQFCLTKDIDMSGVANFVPIGDNAHPFTNPFRGVLDGQGHVIRNLRIKSGLESVGLFITFGRAGVIKDLGLVNVNVTATSASPRVGALVGQMLGPIPGDPPNKEKVVRVHVTGSVRAHNSALIGGLVGDKTGGSISESYSAASVTADQDNSIGGLVGVQSFGKISKSYATGPVTADSGPDGGDNIGGLVGNSQNDESLVEFSYATGPVTEKGSYSYVGGLIGKNDAPVRNSYATGRVTAGINNPGGVGGLIGNNTAEAELKKVFAAGAVSAGTGSSVAGLVGQNFAPAAVVISPDETSVGKAVASAYWDTETSGQSVGATITPVGTGLTTAQLQAGLPAGFSGTLWTITPGLSYPRLKSAGFSAPLATTVFQGKLFTFLPIGQRERFEYQAKPAHSDKASKAAAFTVLARAIGITRGVATLKGVKIDKYFWNDATRTASWKGPATAHASLGAVTAISNAQAIGSAVTGALEAHKLVLLRGRYRKAGGAQAAHWVLATSYIKSGSAVTRIVADDPWTGEQVQIDRTTKAVVAPAGFPLNQFKVNGFQIVTLN